MKGKDEDIKEMIKECGLKHAAKIKLTDVIQKIPSEQLPVIHLNSFHNLTRFILCNLFLFSIQTVIDPQEKEAILKMQSKLKQIKNSITNIDEAKNG